MATTNHASLHASVSNRQRIGGVIDFGRVMEFGVRTGEMQFRFLMAVRCSACTTTNTFESTWHFTYPAWVGFSNCGQRTLLRGHGQSLTPLETACGHTRIGIMRLSRTLNSPGKMVGLKFSAIHTRQVSWPRRRSWWKCVSIRSSALFKDILTRTRVSPSGRGCVERAVLVRK